MNIAIIDDHDDIKYAIEKILQKDNHTCYGFCGDESDLEEGINVFNIELIILDMMLGDSLTGIDVLNRLKDNQLELPIIMITGYTTPSNIIKASKAGITEIIQKPFSKKEILEAVNKFKTQTPKKQISFSQGEEEFIGSFENMKEIYKTIGMAANSDANILITGDTGTGKDLVAKLIHNNSFTKERPFIAINCANIPENLFEKMFFGRDGKQFKNSDADHIGYAQKAEGGTLFLDDIQDLCPEVQGKLLRFIETKSFSPVGSSKEFAFSGRVIAASLLSSKKLLKTSHFRDDLFYRVSTLEISLPKLEERKADIVNLVHYFIANFSNNLQLSSKTISSEAVLFLENHSFKGNVRELKNIIYKAMLSSSTDEISLENIVSVTENQESDNQLLNTFCQEIYNLYSEENISQIFEDFEKIVLEKILQKNQNKSQVAKLLSISRNTLKEKIKRYGIE